MQKGALSSSTGLFLCLMLMNTRTAGCGKRQGSCITHPLATQSACLALNAIGRGHHARHRLT